MSNKETQRPYALRRAFRPRAEARFGTFGGVFTPCTLTILGVIMFLRLGRVVGNTGLVWALVVVVVAKAITTLTSLSLSAVATNTRVRGGGAYFLISRSLGVESGGAIGVVFYLAQAVSVAMYVIGFCEALLATVPDLGLTAREAASLVNLVVFVCVYVGAGWTLRLQYGILAVLGLAIASFCTGAWGSASPSQLSANLGSGYGPGENLFTMFALFFPAVTGIMAGANMSGDLKDPARSIPRGTLAAVLVTGVVYVAMTVLLAASCPRDELLTNDMVVRERALVPLLVTLGVFAATLSSALGSMMGAPRILQALGRDGIFRTLRFFGPGSAATNEPRRAIVLTFVIAQVCILLGDLDAIAPVITMFFIITYGYLNLATFYESITRNPSYRPTFRYTHWATALAGAVLCLGVMFLISPAWAAGSIAAMALLHWYIGRREILATWGDVHGGAAFERARKTILKLEDDRYHPKNWRPSVLAMIGNPRTRARLAVYGHWLTAGRGMLTLAQVIPGDVGEHLQRRENQEKALRSFIVEQELEALPAVLVARDLPRGVEALVQCYGMGALRPNVVLLGWSSDPERSVPFAALLRTISQLGRSVVVLRSGPQWEDTDPWLPPDGPIHVWWRGKANGHLLVLLAHLLDQNDAWRGKDVVLFRMVPNEAGREGALEHLTRLLADARVRAEAEVVVGDDFATVLHETSQGAAVVFLGFQPPGEGGERGFVGAIEHFTDGLGHVVLAWSSGDMHLEA